MNNLKFILACILIGVVCSGCSSYRSLNADQIPESCVIAHGSTMGIDVQLLCVDGIQYIRHGSNLTVYWASDNLSLNYPYLRRCACPEDK